MHDTEILGKRIVNVERRTYYCRGSRQERTCVNAFVLDDGTRILPSVIDRDWDAVDYAVTQEVPLAAI